MRFRGLLALVLLLAGCTAPRVAPPMAASPSPSPSPAVVTNVGDRTAARADVLRGQVRLLLEEQSKALLRQDQEGFLRPARTYPPRNELDRRYRNLLALRVAVFEMIPYDLRLDEATGHYKVTTRVAFCFVVPACRTDSVDEPMVFADTADGPELVSLAAAVGDPEQWFGETQPWEISDLQVAVGTRTVVATTSRLQGRLPEVLREAEEAALIADRFVTGGRKPDLYRIYLADRTEWNQWYGGGHARWVAGFAITIGEFHSDIVLNNSKATTTNLDDMLTHEMAHVASLHGRHYWRGHWWLIEGLAMHVENPSGLRQDDWASATHSYIRNGWDRKLPVARPPDDMSDSAVGARYGVAYYAVKCLDTHFGHEPLLAFFQYVVDSAHSLESASQSSFGKPWSEVEATCIAAIRQAAR